MEKCGVLQFGANNLTNGASYMLDHCRILIGNYIWQIVWYHLQMSMIWSFLKLCFQSVTVGNSRM